MDEIMNAVLTEAAGAWKFAKHEAAEYWEELKDSTIVTKRSLVLGGIACFAAGVMVCSLCKPKQIIIQAPAEEEEDDEVE